MFNRKYGCTLYSSLFSKKRFEFLIRAIRFDNREDRQQLLLTDRFAHIRVLWDKVISNCIANWVPGPIVTVDEQLAGFRGKCPFRMYIQNKPAKYGIKLFMVCDSESNYAINAIPYLGANGDPALQELQAGNRRVLVSHYYTMKLLHPVLHPNRTVCMDNWFTSMPVAQDLLSHQMHIVGTIRRKPYLPIDHVRAMKIPLKESVALYNHEHKVNVVYQRVKPQKYVAILTTVHNSFSNVEKQKTEASMYYNAAKGGVDAFDQMCATSNCGRKTRRWPLAMFYNMVNLIINNAYIIFKSRPGNNQSRHDFNTDLAYALAKPYAQMRYNDRHNNLPRHTKQAMWQNFRLDEIEQQRRQARLQHPQQPHELSSDSELDDPPMPLDSPAAAPPIASAAEPPTVPAVVPTVPAAVPIVPAAVPAADARFAARHVGGPAAHYPEFPGRIKTQKRKRCDHCNRSTQSGRQLCNKCKGFVCNDHSALVCISCWFAEFYGPDGN